MTYSTSRPSLCDLAVKHRTDKLTHGYLPAYEAHFGPLRDKVERLLEIGIGGYEHPEAGGSSLRLWRDYFPKAQVVGLDVQAKTFEPGDRITIVRGSQADPVVLHALSAQHGPFDVVIDDGSHVNAHRNQTFELLFPLMADDGLYVLEDLHTSYLQRAYRGNRAGTREPTTTMGMLAQRVDGLNHQYIPGYSPSPLDRQIRAVCFFPKIAFVYKGSNEQQVHWTDQRAIDEELARR